MPLESNSSDALRVIKGLTVETTETTKNINSIIQFVPPQISDNDQSLDGAVAGEHHVTGPLPRCVQLLFTIRNRSKPGAIFSFFFFFVLILN